MTSRVAAALSAAGIAYLFHMFAINSRLNDPKKKAVHVEVEPDSVQDVDDTSSKKPKRSKAESLQQMDEEKNQESTDAANEWQQAILAGFMQQHKHEDSTETLHKRHGKKPKFAFGKHSDFDLDKDGFLNLKEIQNLFLAVLGENKGLGHSKVEKAAHIFESLDKDGDSQISVVEFEAGLPELNSLTWLSDQEDIAQSLQQILEHGHEASAAVVIERHDGKPKFAFGTHFDFDLDQDGLLNLKEIQSLFLSVLGRTKGFGYDKIEKAARVVESLDKDGDSRISMDEFDAGLSELNLLTWLAV